MATESFCASRWTKGNHLFATVIEVTEAAVVRRKRAWFTVNEISIHLSKVASVRIDTGLRYAATCLLHLGDHFAVVRYIAQYTDRSVILGSTSQHRWTADVYILYRLFQSFTRHLPE